MNKIIDFNKQQIKKYINRNSSYLAIFDGRRGKCYSGKWIFELPIKSVQSSLMIKAVLGKESRLDLDILSKIPSKISGADFSLAIQVLMLDDSCMLKISPSMEISENRVKAKHSLAISNIDPDQLFYLTSRGLPRSKAIDLIIEGFLKN